MRQPTYTDEEISHNRAMLTDALRSGHYTQGRGKYCHIGDDGQPQFCVVGLAAEVSGLGKWSTHTYAPNSPVRKFRLNDTPDDPVFTHALESFYGLTFEQMDELIALNDSNDRLTFADLADHLDDLARVDALDAD